MKILIEISINEIKLNLFNIKLSQLLFLYKLAIIIAELYIGIQIIAKHDPLIFREKFDTAKNLFHHNVFAAKQCTFLYINIKHFVFPQLRPRKEYNEYKIEKYIKYFNLLMSLKLITTLLRFKKFFISANNLFKFIQIYPLTILI
jgi:hypothetical protein